MRELIDGQLRRRGNLADVLIDDAELGEEQLHPAAATSGVIPQGRRAGEHATLFGDAPNTPNTTRPTKRLCADAAGYALHAAIRYRAPNRWPRALPSSPSGSTTYDRSGLNANPPSLHCATFGTPRQRFTPAEF